MPLGKLLAETGFPASFESLPNRKAEQAKTQCGAGAAAARLAGGSGRLLIR